MAYTRVKICGITRAEDAARAADFGADVIGLNFFAGPRRITLDRAVEIVREIPPLITPVALTSGPTTEFPDAPTFEEIQHGPSSGGRAPLRISTFQFYGTSLLLMAGKGAVWTVCSVSNGNIVSQIASHHISLNFSPSIWIIDAAATGRLGGTGRKVDWKELRDAMSICMQKEVFRHVVLAGGLTPENVAEAIRIVRPYAVDVSSGVEVAGKPGIKDAIKMRDFIQAAKSVG